MKRHASIAGLALRLTWKPVTLFLLILCLLQQVIYDPALMVTEAFEYTLEWTGSFLDFTFLSKFGFLVLFFILVLAYWENRGSKLSYTFGRLGICEVSVAAVFSMVFALYFFLYWAVQLGMISILYQRYALWTHPSNNILLLAAYRSPYFHALLPLAEWSGYVRNICLCISFGSIAALSWFYHSRKHTFSALPLFVLIIHPLFPTEVGSMGQDIALTVLFLFLTVLCWYLYKRGVQDET